MKFAPMNYHYLRYPIKKFLDKVERSPFNSIDLYCSAPQLNLFDYPLLRLIELKKEIEAHHLSVMAMTPENCVYPVNFCTQDDLTRESSIRYYQRAIDTAQFLDCPCVQISTGFGYFDQPREEGWKYCRESLWTLAQYCEKKDVRLLLEELKVTTTNVLITSKDIAKMLEEIESPSIVGMVDMDQMTYAKETIDDYFDNLGDKLQHIHFNDRGHTVPGDGDFPRFFQNRRNLYGMIRVLRFLTLPDMWIFQQRWNEYCRCLTAPYLLSALWTGYRHIRSRFGGC